MNTGWGPSAMSDGQSWCWWLMGTRGMDPTRQRSSDKCGWQQNTRTIIQISSAILTATEPRLQSKIACFTLNMTNRYTLISYYWQPVLLLFILICSENVTYRLLLRHGDTYSISREICTRFCCAFLCCGYAIVHNEFTWSIYPYSSGLLCWHWGNL